MVEALTWAVHHNRTFIVAEDYGWLYADPAMCGVNRTISCMLPTSMLRSSCTMADVTRRASTPHAVIKFFNWQFYDGSVQVDNAVSQIDKLRLVPARYAKRGVFWWVSQLVSAAFRPTPMLLDALSVAAIAARQRDSKKSNAAGGAAGESKEGGAFKWGLERREGVVSVSMHLRHGKDKVGWTCGNCQPGD
jgi:hypothetical protein